MAIRLLIIFGRAILVTLVVVCFVGLGCRFLDVDGKALGISDYAFGIGLWGVSFMIAVIDSAIYVSRRTIE